jgi:tetratricopeptide (TPR) repeat protein
MTTDEPLRRPSDRFPTRIGRYEIEGRIGKGAMGVVYAARDEAMNRQVALKVMTADPEGEPDIRARFFREAQIAAKLGHRNIVTVFDIAEEDARLYIVMELLHGQTLDKYLKDRRLDLEDKIDLMLQICAGLAVASAAGVYHRDIKPGNLFVQEDGILKILDFGIARLADSNMTASGFIVGTPDYMSPEQARGLEVDERSDIFSAGAVFYFMLSGRKPFTAPDWPAVLHKVIAEPVQPLTDMEAPIALRQVVEQMLAKDPSERVQSFRELTAEITRFKRQYDSDTAVLASVTLRQIGDIEKLIGEETVLAGQFGAEPHTDVVTCRSQLMAAHPHFLEQGIDALTGSPVPRRLVIEISERVAAMRREMDTRVGLLRMASADLQSANEAAASGDFRKALDRLERLAIVCPGLPAVQTALEGCRRSAAERDAAESRAKALFSQAQMEQQAGRLASAEQLAAEAVNVVPADENAQQFLRGIRDQIVRDLAERRARAEHALDQCRRALEREAIEEAEGYVAQAEAADPDWLEIVAARSSVADADRRRGIADAMLMTLTQTVANARRQVAAGAGESALQPLQELASAHPEAQGLVEEIERLRVQAEQVAAAARASAEAERRVALGEEAWAMGDAAAALKYAEQALAASGSDERALRNAAMARSRLRELAERETRAGRARDHLAKARAAQERGRHDLAIREARQAVDFDPAGHDSAAFLSELLRRDEQQIGEAAARDEAARVSRTLKPMVVQARAALQSHDFAVARRLVEQIIALDPGTPEAHDLVQALVGGRGADPGVPPTVIAEAAPVADPDDTVTIPIEHEVPAVEPRKPPAWQRLSDWITRRFTSGSSSATAMLVGTLALGGWFGVSHIDRAGHPHTSAPQVTLR